MFQGNNESEFNSGLAIIYQLDSIEKEMHQATIEQNYKRQYLAMICYFKTLWSHMTQKEKEFHLKMWNNMKQNYKILQTTVIKGKNTVPTRILDSFNYWELELRDTKQRHGLGMPEKDKRYQPSVGRG